MPDLRSLRQFLHLAESLHFGRSSEALYVSPSTLSRTISRLEDELGAPLFIRDNRTVTLTDGGVKFRAFALQTLSTWRELKESLVAGPGELTGRIRIYCSVTASYSFLSTILARFRERHPLVEVSVITGDASFSVEQVLDQHADVGIAPRPDQLQKQLQFKSVVETPLLFIAPSFDCPVNAMLRQPDIRWSEVPLVLPEYGLSRKRLDDWFKQKGIKPNVQTEVAGHEAIVSMVALGMGVGVVPELVYASSPMKKQIMLIEDAPALRSYDVGMVVLERRLNDPVIAGFWATVSELVQQSSGF